MREEQNTQIYDILLLSVTLNAFVKFYIFFRGTILFFTSQHESSVLKLLFMIRITSVKDFNFLGFHYVLCL